MSQQSRFNTKSLNCAILIEIRNLQVKKISEKLLKLNIIPLEYIDEEIRLQCIINKIPFNINYDSRLEYLNNILLKECKKGTSKLISDLC